MYKLDYPRSQVIYGYDALEWLGNIKEKKVALVTTRSLLKSKILSEVLKLVSASVIEGPRQHVPESDLNSLSEKLKGYEIVIGLGGGSIIDGIKLATEAFYIAIPTTLSGAEHTRSGGYTADGVKRSKLGKDADVIILDPRATLETPKWLLVTSGVRSLDHAIEALYSTQSTPFTDALAIEGYKKLINCLRNLESLEDRLYCQIGSWLSSITMRYVKMGMSHMFGYVFGPRFNIPHGVTSCISLPIAVKFNYEIAKHKLKEIEREEPLYVSIDNFLKEIGVRKRLSEFVPSLEDALNYAKVFSELVNNSGNPLKVDLKTAEDFIKEAY